MKPADVCLAVLVALIWGFGFVATRLALDELSPALMTTLRFAIAAVPCLFVRKPDVSWRLLIAISITLFLGQFLAQSWAIAQRRAGRACQRDRAEPGAVHGGVRRVGVRRDSDPPADGRDRRCRDRPA